MLGFSKDFSCHSHLGPIRIPPLFPSAPFLRNEKEGTLELYYLSAYCLPQILLLKWGGHGLVQLKSCLLCFPMLKLPYQVALSGIARLNILIGCLVLTLLCGIHSRSDLGFGKRGNSSQNPTTSPTALPPTPSRTSETEAWFLVLSSIGYSSPFVALVPLSVEISSQEVTTRESQGTPQ